jgi:anti-sigma-K factor RskA
MSDDIRNRDQPDPDDVGDIEQLLRELDLADLEQTPPPPEVWAGIDDAVRQDTVVALPSVTRRRAGRVWLIAAAAALVALIAAAVLVAARRGDPEEVVATAVLTHDAATFDPRGAGATATAHLLERDGRYEIQLSDADLPTVPDDDLELWLIEPDAQGKPKDIAPISLINSTKPGVYAVPAGLNPSSHYVVDISIEPRDGDVAHSGHSILRGPLEAS